MLKQGIFVKTQQLSGLFLRGTNLVQDLERFLHCILHFALSFNVKLLNQELEMLQRGVQETNNQTFKSIIPPFSEVNADQHAKRKMLERKERRKKVNVTE